jgi:aldose 1-epimerase
MSDRITLRDPKSGSTAQVAPGLGFNCFEFKAHVGGQVVDVLDTQPGFFDGSTRPSGSGIPLLFPFPNRIAHGRYSWNGREYQLPLPPGREHAIHGFCLDRPWRVTHQSESSVTGVFQLSVDAPDRLPLWPTDFWIEVSYAVQGATLASRIRVQNPTDVPLPWGFGTHSYFKIPLLPSGDPTQCSLFAAASKKWPLQDNLPSGTPEPVSAAADLRQGIRYGTVQLDDLYTHLVPENHRHETSVVDESTGLRLVQSFGIEFRELIAFTPPRPNVVCLEPYTCATNAVNLEAQGVNAGWSVLAPGAEFETWINIEIR